jgi:hypothetical protein
MRALPGASRSHATAERTAVSARSSSEASTSSAGERAVGTTGGPGVSTPAGEFSAPFAQERRSHPCHGRLPLSGFAGVSAETSLRRGAGMPPPNPPVLPLL